IEVEICGLVDSSNPNINKNLVLLPLDIVQKSLHIDNQISKVIVILSNKDMAKELGNQLKSTIDKNTGNNVYFWYDLEAISFAGAKNAGNQLMMMMILFIAAIAIINTVILAALERMEEIGMMKAMGLEEKEIVYTFVMESAGIGLLGGIAGVMLGLAGVWLCVTYGFDWSVMTSMELSSFGMPIIGKMYGSWNIAAFVNIFFFGIIVSVLSSILPAHWAASKDPIKAIYHR
ncbi:FtsX-like permease family protein, partial [candidate division WOR-3 bacterium]|nr:FtsX-like permease family protein [candidate division WOR-3 bacterium]